MVLVVLLRPHLVDIYNDDDLNDFLEEISAESQTAKCLETPKIYTM